MTIGFLCVSANPSFESSGRQISSEHEIFSPFLLIHHIFMFLFCLSSYPTPSASIFDDVILSFFVRPRRLSPSLRLGGALYTAAGGGLSLAAWFLNSLTVGHPGQVRGGPRVATINNDCFTVKCNSIKKQFLINCLLYMILHIIIKSNHTGLDFGKICAFHFAIWQAKTHEISWNTLKALK